MTARLWMSTLSVIVAMSLLAAAMSSIFIDFAWLTPVLVIILVVAGSGLLLRMSPRIQASGLTVLLQLVIGGIAVLVLCVPDTLAAGIIPTPTSVFTLFGQLGDGIDDMYKVVAPADSTPGFSTILTVGFGLVTMLVDGLVADLHVPKVGGVLLLLVYCIPVFLAPNELRWWHFACVAAAFIVLLLTPYLDAVGLRGPAAPLVAGALALALGIGIPVLLPDVSMRPPRKAQQADITVVNPFLDLRSNLADQSDKPVLAYRSQDALEPPLRLTSVSEFDGRTWKPSEFDIDPFAVAVDGLPAPQGVNTATHTTEQSAQINVGGFDQSYLPAPYAPARIEGISRRWIFDKDTLTIVGNGEIAAEQKYSVDYTSVEPSADDLAHAKPVSASRFASTLALPKDTPDVVSRTAEEVTAGAKNQWEQAVKLQEYFRSDDFSYSLDAPDVASNDAIADFLSQKRGYCVQFSGAMTAMARSLGIPARIGVGFAPGQAAGDGSRTVKMSDSHAWPELYFSGVGWVRFEPTPGGPAGNPPPWSQADGGSQPDEKPTEEPTPEASASPSAEPSAQQTPPPADDNADGADASAQPGFPWWIPLTVLIVALLAALPAVVRVLQRRRRLAAPVDPEVVWEEIRALGIDYRMAPEASVPVRDHLTALRDAVTDGASADTDRGYLAAVFDDLAEAIDQARYLDRSRNDLQHASPQVDTAGTGEAIEAIRRHYDAASSRPQALRARLWPSSVFRGR